MVTLEETISWIVANYDWLSIFGIILIFSLLAVKYFRNKQVKDREPIVLLLIAVTLGLLSIIPSILLSLIMLIFVPEAYGSVIVAPIAEEIGKGLVLGIIAWTRIVDDPFDGFVYGAMVGIGFAAGENFLYAYSALTSSGLLSGIFLVSFRSAFQIIGHPLYTGITGYGIGLYKQGKKEGKYNMIWLAMLLHGLWNATNVFYTQYWIYTFPSVVLFSILLMKIIISKARSHQ